MPLMKSWVESANAPDCDFPLNNLPYGVFSTDGEEPRCGVAIGDQILDLAEAEEAGLVGLGGEPLFAMPFWNDLMEQGPAVWAALRERLTGLLAEGSADRGKVEPMLVPMAKAEMHLPCVVSETSRARRSDSSGRRLMSDFFSSSDSIAVMVLGSESSRSASSSWRSGPCSASTPSSTYWSAVTPCWAKWRWA